MFPGCSQGQTRIYPDGFRCFGCGAAGDAVAFVQLLEGITPLEAARRIAEAFGIATSRPVSTAHRQAISERQRETEAVKKFQHWERETFLGLCRLRDKLTNELQTHGLDIPDEQLAAIHKIPYIEHVIGLLATGDDAEKFELFKNWTVE
jgi:DNA primase